MTFINYFFSPLFLFFRIYTKIASSVNKFSKNKKNFNLFFVGLFLLTSNVLEARTFFEEVSTNLKNEIIAEFECYLADSDSAAENYKAQRNYISTEIEHRYLSTFMNPIVTAFAIQPSCTDGSANNDGYLQLSAVTDGDKLNFSTGSTYTGDIDYANAITIGALPFQFNTGLSNPSGSQAYTIRVFNGESSVFTDVVVTMNEQDCTVGCSCTETIYLNDAQADAVHKYTIGSSGMLSEIGSPWLPAGTITSPHGLGVDLNGRLYIGQAESFFASPRGPIFQLNCDGEVLDNDFVNLITPENDFGFQLFSKDGILYTNPNGMSDAQAEIQAYNLCDGESIGRLSTTPNGAYMKGWGMYLDEAENNWYVPDRVSGNVYVGTLDTSSYTAPSTAGGTVLFNTGFPEGGAAEPDNSAMGITRDVAGNFYIIFNSINGLDSIAHIRKYDASGNLITTISDDNKIVNNTNGQSGFWGARGIIYSEAENKLYVSNFANCITVFDTGLVEQTSLNVGNPLGFIDAFGFPGGSLPKGIAITKECCPTNNNVTIDTALCGAAINDKLFLQELINCSGTICEGIWTAGGSNTGLTYNACDNSVTIDAANACGTFSLESDGTGNNPQCGAFTITVNISVSSLELSVNKTSCVDNSDGTFTANYDAIVDWNSQPCEAGDMINVTHNGTSIGMIDPSTDTSPSTFSLGISADGNGTNIIKAAFISAGCVDSISFKSPVACPIDVTPCAATSGCLGGNVFEDFNCNGTDDATEPGIEGIEVQIYDCNNNLVGTGYSDSDGDWQVCSLTDGTAYRVEFVLPEAIACWATPTHVGSDNGSDIQFLTAPACTQFSVSNPTNYCEDTAPLYLLTPCYSFGASDGTYGANEAFVGVLVNEINDPTIDAANTKIVYATKAEIGATYGTSINKNENKAYVAAYMKRHSGFGPGGTGAIYEIDLSQSSAPQLLVDLNSVYGAGTAGVDSHPFGTTTTCANGSGGFDNFNCWFNDVDAFNKVGRTSLGDMDISADEQFLYVMNMEDRNVYVVDLNNPTAAQTRYPFPLNQDIDPAITNVVNDPILDIRPMGMTLKNNKLYVVAVDAQLSASSGGFGGSVVFVYALDLSTGTWDLVLEEDIQRGNRLFIRWRDTYIGDYRDNSHMIPSDIVFDGDDIILGLRDLSADQFGNQAGKPIAGDNATVFYASQAGDIVRFDYDASTTSYIFENNGSSGGVTTSGAGSGYGWPASSTPRGSYFSGDYYSSAHPETVLGGLVLDSNSGKLYSTVYDLTEVYQSGIKSLDLTDGEAKESYVLIEDTEPNGGLGKANGLGDLELLESCGLAPLEIGNYVWCDSLENGIQDACERGINDIIVQLYDRNGLLVGQDTTINGQYYFNQYNVDTTGISVDGSGVATPTTAWSGMSYSTQYFIVFGGGQFTTDEFTVGSDTYGITSFANTGSNDNIDSDVDGSSLTAGNLGTRPDGLPFIDMITGATGCGDHKYDLGVTCVEYDWGDLPDGTNSTGINDYQTSSANNGPVHVIIPGLSLGVTVDGETDGQPSSDALGDGLDEDGLTIFESLDITPGGTFRLPLNYTNTTGLPAHIEAWIDWNANGEFDAGEMVLDVTDASAGTYDRLEVTVPTDAVTGEFLGLRIRISNQDNMTPYGLINGGEIEDYLIGIACKTQICLPINVTINRQ